MLAIFVYALLLYPVYWSELYVWRELLRFADSSGITRALGNTTGALGGQILLYNYLRHPEWFGELTHFLAILIVNLPALGIALLVYHRWTWRFVRGETRCGRCGAVLKSLIEPRCSACGEQL